MTIDSITAHSPCVLPDTQALAPRWVRLTGHVEGHFSLAIVNRSLARELARQTGGRVHFVPYHEQPYREPPRLTGEPDTCLHEALLREIPAHAVPRTLSIVQHYPFIADPLPSGVRGLLFFWEETSVSAAVVQHIQAHFDIVWVTASFVRRALINSGCSVPVLVIPIGIDHLIDDSEPPLDELRPAPQHRFRFLHVSSAFDRKGVDVLLAAYLDAFTADDPVELHIKTSPSPHNTLEARLAEALKGIARPARITVDQQDLDNAAMRALYRSAQAMVLPTRGEGFSLPAAEALALGLPVITTGHGGQADFCTPATARLVRFRFAPSRSHVRTPDSCWLEPDPAHLAEQMRELYQEVVNQAPELAARRETGIRQVRATYRWEHCARAILDSAERLVKPKQRADDSLRVALISPWGSDCDIAEHARRLLQPGVQSGKLRLSVYCDEHADARPVEAEACWQRGSNSGLHGLLERLPQTDCELVFVQHHPALFSLTATLCDQLLTLRNQGRIIMLELHSTLFLQQVGRPDADTVQALAHLDRIIVHHPQDLNNLLDLGLADNVMLLPLGYEPGALPADRDWAALCKRLIGMMQGLRLAGEYPVAMVDEL